MKIALLLPLLAFAVTATAERYPYSRYQSIVDRQMFGELPPDFDPEKLPSEVTKSGSRGQKELTKEQEKVQSSIRFSIINKTPEGEVAVGFTDNSDAKAPKHYYLKVGEEQGEWKVLKANAEEKSMTIAKGDIEVELTLGDDSSKNQNATQRTQASSQRNGLLSMGARRAARRQQQEAARQQQEAARRQQEEERRLRDEEEANKRETEREEHRQQLLAIQEELRRVTEAKAAEAKKNTEESENAKSDGE